MKKMMLVAVALIIGATAGMAQEKSAAQLAKEKKELNELNRKLLDTKPSKEAKKQAKQLQKEKWTVMAGSRSMEQQINESLLYDAELMQDENGAPTKRFLIQDGMSTSGSYNSGRSAAMAAARTELAGLLKTEIVAAIQQKLDNAQHSALDATTVDKFNERARQIVDATLTNSIPVMTIYRRLPNNNFEVQVRLAFDKKELKARMKRNMEKELEKEGDELNSVIDEVFSNR